MLLVISNIILLVWLRGGIYAYLLSLSLGYGVSGIVAFLYLGKCKLLRFTQIDKPLLKDMLSYCLPCIPNMIS